MKEGVTFAQARRVPLPSETRDKEKGDAWVQTHRRLGRDAGHNGSNETTAIVARPAWPAWSAWLPGCMACRMHGHGLHVEGLRELWERGRW